VLNEQKSAPSLLLLLFIEAWERFSYYGMRALLVLYLTSSLGFDDPKAYKIYALFAAIIYAIPPLAGILADKYVGFQKIMIIGAIIMCLGHFSLGLTYFSSSFIYLGLPLIAAGTGFFKGNVTSLLGAIYEDEKIDSFARDKGFSLFYVAINFGSAISSVLCGYIAYKFGWHYGFAIAGIGMLISLLTFLKYRYILGNHGISPNVKQDIFSSTEIVKALSLGSFLVIFPFFVIYCNEFFSSYFGYFGLIVVGILCKVLYNCSSQERGCTLLLMILTFFLFCFFAIEMQLGSLIVLFTERNVDRMIAGYEIPSATLQAINPFTILILGPILSGFLSTLNKNGPFTRFSLGLFSNVICFILIYVGCLYSSDGKSNLIYLVFGVIFMALTELCIVPLLQSLFTTLSPTRYKGFLMGILMFALSYSNLTAILISKFMSISPQKMADPEASMMVYREGFLYILLFNIGLFLLFLIIRPFLNRLFKKCSKSL
jgi:proton-dependent oligopeptide transporter, POT family